MQLRQQIERGNFFANSWKYRLFADLCDLKEDILLTFVISRVDTYRTLKMSQHVKK